MANKYGKNGEAVAIFLDEVAATDLDGWRAFLDLESPGPEFTAAVRAVNKVPMSASVNSAVYGACLRTTRGLGLGQLDRRMAASTVGSRVRVAAKALALASPGTRSDVASQSGVKGLGAGDGVSGADGASGPVVGAGSGFSPGPGIIFPFGPHTL